jgi:ribose/xylose/arabinose/galactoside ABC-type transport system permease subunit
MAAMLIVLALLAPGFLSLANLRDIPINASHVAIAALGMFLLIVIGQIDVSVGAILAISATACGLAAKAGWSVSEIVLIATAIGGLLGFVNGALVTIFSVHSIVVTLGMLSIYRGLLIFFTGGTWVYDLPPSFGEIGQGTIVGIPNPVAVTVVLYLIAGFLLANTRIGRELFAVGSNPNAARLAGVSRVRIQMLAFILNGVLVGIASLLFASRFTVIQSNAGAGFEFAVITAVVVGGASIFGGSGSVLGTLLGALVISFATTALVFLGVSSLWEQALMGAFVLAAVLLDKVRFVEGLRRIRERASL